MECAKTIHMQDMPFLTINTDGTVKRHVGGQTTQASPHNFTDGAKSKDVTVDTDTGVFVRIFLPEQQNPTKLPILFYIHGGGFCVESADSTVYHKYMTKVAKQLGLLCVSVNYRRCPEHRLPAAYDDCFGALRWLLTGPGKDDSWIANHGDLSRVFMAGDSAGGNIIHEIGLRAGRAEWGADVRFEGAVFVHPFFFTGEAPAETDKDFTDCILPAGEDLTYPPFNPVGARSPAVSEIVFERSLVVVAEKDFIYKCGLFYYGALKDAGKHVELFESPGEGHVFHLFDMECSAASVLMERIREFFHPCKA